MWALTDFTEETGATRVVPGSNRWEENPVIGKHYDTRPMAMPKGSICVFVGTTIHGGGYNRSGRDRPGLIVGYNRGSMRTQENYMLGVHPARMMTFPRELQDLLGFKVCNGAGNIFGQDPRVEMERHYGGLDPADPYLEGPRDALHEKRRSGGYPESAPMMAFFARVPAPLRPPVYRAFVGLARRFAGVYGSIGPKQETRIVADA